MGTVRWGLRALGGSPEWVDDRRPIAEPLAGARDGVAERVAELVSVSAAGRSCYGWGAGAALAGGAGMRRPVLSCGCRAVRSGRNSDVADFLAEKY
jgi:hypothetical protein